MAQSALHEFLIKNVRLQKLCTETGSVHYNKHRTPFESHLEIPVLRKIFCDDILFLLFNEGSLDWLLGLEPKLRDSFRILYCSSDTQSPLYEKFKSNIFKRYSKYAPRENSVQKQHLVVKVSFSEWGLEEVFEFLKKFFECKGEDHHLFQMDLTKDFGCSFDVESLASAIATAESSTIGFGIEPKLNYLPNLVGYNCLIYKDARPSESSRGKNEVRFKVYNKFCQALESFRVEEYFGDHLRDWIGGQDTMLGKSITKSLPHGYTRIELSFYDLSSYSEIQDSLALTKEYVAKVVSLGVFYRCSIQDQWKAFCENLGSSCMLVCKESSDFLFANWVSKSTKKVGGCFGNLWDKSLIRNLLPWENSELISRKDLCKSLINVLSISDSCYLVTLDNSKSAPEISIHKYLLEGQREVFLWDRCCTPAQIRDGANLQYYDYGAIRWTGQPKLPLCVMDPCPVGRAEYVLGSAPKKDPKEGRKFGKPYRFRILSCFDSYLKEYQVSVHGSELVQGMSENTVVMALLSSGPLDRKCNVKMLTEKGVVLRPSEQILELIMKDASNLRQYHKGFGLYFNENYKPLFKIVPNEKSNPETNLKSFTLELSLEPDSGSQSSFGSGCLIPDFVLDCDAKKIEKGAEHIGQCMYAFKEYPYRSKTKLMVLTDQGLFKSGEFENRCTSLDGPKFLKLVPKKSSVKILIGNSDSLT